MNTNHIIGLAVVNIGTGERLGSVSEILFDPALDRVTGFAIDTGGGGMLSSQEPGTSWIAAQDVHAIGPDALTVQDASALSEAAAEGEATPLSVLIGEKVVTEGGTFVGKVASAEIDESNMTATGLEVSPGFFKSNRVVHKADLVTVGEELVVVADSVVAKPPAQPAQAEEGEGEAGEVIYDTGESTRIYGAPPGNADEQ